MCDILQTYLTVRNIFSIFVAEFATILVIFRRTKVRKRYVYTRKRQLDGLPLGHVPGVTPSGESIP